MAPTVSPRLSCDLSELVDETAHAEAAAPARSIKEWQDQVRELVTPMSKERLVELLVSLCVIRGGAALRPVCADCPRPCTRAPNLFR